MRRHIIATVIMALSLFTFNSCSKDDNNMKEYQEYLEKQLNDNTQYLNENMKREGVVTTESGLQYEVLSLGDGEGKSPIATDYVRCHYEGTLIDGTMFDSSIKRGAPSDFPLNGVISGWTEGLQLMKEGDKYRFFIPYYLGYGASGYATIPPYATLIFDVELIMVM